MFMSDYANLSLGFGGGHNPPCLLFIVCCFELSGDFVKSRLNFFYSGLGLRFMFATWMMLPLTMAPQVQHDVYFWRCGNC